MGGGVRRLKLSVWAPSTTLRLACARAAAGHSPELRRRQHRAPLLLLKLRLLLPFDIGQSWVVSMKQSQEYTHEGLQDSTSIPQ